MLCRRCSQTAPEARPLHLTAPGVGVASGVWCARCGEALGPRNLTERLVAKLAQLARFGLDSEGRPLLEPANGDR